MVKSHIIPDFFYRPLKDELGGIIRIDNSHREQRIGFPKSGEYEKLLCFECDNQRIGKLDDFMSNYVNNDSVIVHTSKQRQIAFPVNYKKLKLFLLSVLWKACVSSRPFWSNVTLPEHVEEELRKLILQGKPGHENKYPCICINFSDEKVKNPFFVMSPLHYKEKEPASEYFTFIFGGHMWVYFLDEESYKKYSKYPLIKDDDRVTVTIKQLSGVPFIDTRAKEDMRKGVVD